MPEHWTVNSEQTKAAFKAQIDRWWDEHKYLTFDAPRIGPDRSIDQNSLFHVWLTEFAAFLAPCHKKEVTKGMVAGTKRTMKRLYYQQTGSKWMVHQVQCQLTGDHKPDFTSSADWGRGEMFDFLTWMQSFAGEKGCILESKGKFAKYQREQNS